MVPVFLGAVIKPLLDTLKPLDSPTIEYTVFSFLFVARSRLASGDTRTWFMQDTGSLASRRSTTNNSSVAVSSLSWSSWKWELRLLELILTVTDTTALPAETPWKIATPGIKSVHNNN